MLSWFIDRSVDSFHVHSKSNNDVYSNLIDVYSEVSQYIIRRGITSSKNAIRKDLRLLEG